MKMNNDRVFAALWRFTLVGVACVALSGCQTGSDVGGKKETGTASNAGSGTKRFKVGVSIPAADHGWTAGIKYWAEKTSKENPDIDWIIEDAKEPGEQISDLENLQTQGVDALVVLATESAPITPIAEKLKNAGILLVSVDRGFTKPIADLYIEGDNKAFGQKSAKFIVEKLGGKGNVAVLEGIPSTVNTDRVDAAMAVFNASPGIKVVGRDSGMWSREKAEKVMQNMLVSNPKIDAIWASDDDMALGVETALKAAGRDKNVWILGGAGMKDIVKRVIDKDPLYPADVTYSPSMIRDGMVATAELLKKSPEDRKKEFGKHVKLPVEIISPENAKDHYFPDSVY